MTQNTTDKEILGIECKHVIYSTAKYKARHDLLTIKERIHYKDGTSEPNVRFIVDFKRPFYITKPAFQNHEQKKEWEDSRKVKQHSSTQIDLADNIYRYLNGNRPIRPMRLREVCRSPFVYGADVTSPVLVKHHYMEKNPEVNGANSSLFTVAGLDTETDVVRGTNEILMTSVVLDDKIYIAVIDTFVKGIPNPKEALHKAFHRYLGKEGRDVIEKNNLKLEVDIVTNEAMTVIETMKRIHRWKPDIVSIWNMDFDIPKMTKALERYGYDPGDVFSDPAVPPPFRDLYYKRGSTQKKTQSGKTTPIPYFDRWHTLIVPASYQVLDAMCVYRKLRFAKGMENGYGLDAVLKRNGIGGKLTFEEGDKYTGLQWHIFMQKNYPIEYCIYNLWDSISMQELDKETGDLRRQIGMHSGHSEFAKFNSQPRRTWDDLEFECRKHNKVVATTSDTLRDDYDSMSVDLNGWIVTLPSHQVDDVGLQLVEEIPQYKTLSFSHVADLDIVSTYPTVQVLANISKETTSCEMVKIEGVSEKAQRSIGINLTGGATNAVEIACKAYKAPSMETLLKDYLYQKEGKENTEREIMEFDDNSGDVIESEEGEN